MKIDFGSNWYKLGTKYMWNLGLIAEIYRAEQGEPINWVFLAWNYYKSIRVARVSFAKNEKMMFDFWFWPMISKSVHWASPVLIKHWPNSFDNWVIFITKRFSSKDIGHLLAFHVDILFHLISQNNERKQLLQVQLHTEWETTKAP